MNIQKIAVVAAMEQEAKALFPTATKDRSGRFTALSGKLGNNINFKCLICGVGYERAGEAARLLCEEQPDLLLSIGVSGGIAPGLPAGTLVAATTIHSEIKEINSWHETERDAAARSDLFPHCGKMQCGPIVTSPEPVLTPKHKQLLHDRTGAIAVDMESIAVAQAAATGGIPFACIRAVSDDSDRTIPAEAIKGVDETGKSQLGPIMKAILKRPALILELIPMGMDYSKALKALAKTF